MQTQTGTKTKQRARARARKAAAIACHGGTAAAMRVTHDTIKKFQPGQKRRRADPIDERFTAILLSAYKASRDGGMPPKLAAPSGPRTAPPKRVRDRTKMRAAGMRFEPEMIDGKPTGRRHWIHVDGTNGGPIKLGRGRVAYNRQQGLG